MDKFLASNVNGDLKEQNVRALSGLNCLRTRIRRFVAMNYRVSPKTLLNRWKTISSTKWQYSEEPVNVMQFIVHSKIIKLNWEVKCMPRSRIWWKSAYREGRTEAGQISALQRCRNCRHTIYSLLPSDVTVPVFPCAIKYFFFKRSII